MLKVTEQVRRELAHTGEIRIALNHGNGVLVSRDEKGVAHGITVDLAHALSETLNLPIKFVHYERAGDVSADAGNDAYDVCFLAVDPERARTLSFTAPYVQIEGRYLASQLCQTADAESLVRERHKVGSVKGSAYTLDLSRKPVAENLVLFPNLQSALAALDEGAVAAIAGIGAVMEKEAVKRSGARVLDPPFMSIRQAMAMPTGRPAAAQFLAQFVSHTAASGRVGEILERHGVSADCAVIAPDAD